MTRSGKLERATLRARDITADPAVWRERIMVLLANRWDPDGRWRDADPERAYPLLATTIIAMFEW